MQTIIAIPFADGKIFQHFGQASQFKLYTIEQGAVVDSEICDTGVIGHDEVALWLVTHGVNVVICDNIGPGSQGALAAAGIITLAGVKETADNAINKLIAGQLEAVQTATCNHHGSGNCGGGSCGCNGHHCHHGGCCH